MSQPQPIPPYQTPPRPHQIRCFGCKEILTVIPPPGVVAFYCPLCQLEQLLPLELQPGSLGSMNQPVQGFNPATMMQVGCYSCMAILNVPRGLTRFKCSLCLTDLAFNIPLIHPILPVKEVFQKTNDKVVMNASSSTPPIEEQHSRGLKRDKEIKEEVEDCSVFYHDHPYHMPLSTNSFISDIVPVQVKDDPDLAIEPYRDQMIRDYPHPRHLCATYPFHSTPHHIHCSTCYCCLCDGPAPCKEWIEGITTHIKHCDATAADIKIWRGLIKSQRKQTRHDFVQAYKAATRS